MSHTTIQLSRLTPNPARLPSPSRNGDATAAEQPDGERVLLIAPLGHDAAAMSTLLSERGLRVRICKDPTEGGEQISKGAGAILLTEEALELPKVENLLRALKEQPDWSELPLIVLTSGGEPRLSRLIDHAADLAGSITLLERPLGSKTLVRAVEGALNSRCRQYRVRDLLQEQQRIQTALRQSEAQFRALSDNIAQLAWMTGADGSILWYNKRWFEFTGTRLEEMQRSGWQRVHHPAYFDRVVQRWTQHLEEGTPWEDTFPLRAANGQYRWFLSRAFPIRDAAGKISMWFGTNTDITELREAELRFRSYVQATAHIIWRTNERGEVDTSLDEWCAFTGQTKSEACGYGWMNAIHPDDRPKVNEAWKKASEAKALYEVEYRLKTRTGKWRDILARAVPVLDHEGNVSEYIGTSIDITDRKQSEQKLRENEAVLRTVTNEARVGLVIIDQERRYIFANRTYAEILGLPDSGLTGKRVADVLSSVYDQIEPNLDRAFKGERVAYELNLPRHPVTGAERIYEVVYEPRLSDPAAPYVVVVIVDITERKLVQQTLEGAVAERTSELKDTNDQLEALVYSIAHDLRTPLRASQGYSEILMETAADDQKPMLKRINESAENMDRMIRDLLEFGRAARAEITFSPVPVQAAWQSALRQNTSEIEKTNAKIEADGEFPTVCAFEPILVQSLSNLLANAMKFVAPGTTPHIRFWSEDKGQKVRLWIEDNGIGIAPQYHERIFRVFERLNISKSAGTGIGLAIVRRGIERIDGKVGVESTPGKGCRFWVELPKA